MKKMIVFIFIFMFVFSVTVDAHADESTAWPPLVKLGRGMANIITSPLEIGKNVDRANQENGTFAALTWGPLQGLADTLVRAVVGVYEVVTFPFPVPAEYQPILTDPEYFLENGH